MTTRIVPALMLALVLTLAGATTMTARQAGSAHGAVPPRPEGPCDVYAAAGAPCAAAHSTTRALYAAYNGPLYQVLRQSDRKTLDVGVVLPAATPAPDAGGYANAAAQDAFCANTYCWISVVYDQSPRHNDLVQAPRGGFSGPAMGGFNNLPLADAAPVTVMGHKVYGAFIAPGMGLRQNDAKGTAVDDQAEGQYWVINGRHYNSGCCFDYGNAETDSRDDGNGTMETTYYGNAPWWYRGSGAGPWIMTDQENNLVGCVNADGSKVCTKLPSIDWRFVTAIAKGEPHHWTSMGGDSQQGPLKVMFDGPRIDFTYDPMRKQGAILLGNGGDNSNGSQGTFYEGAMTAAGTFPSDATDQLVQANVVAAKYDVARVTIAPASATAAPPGLQTLSPGSSQNTTVTFTNVSGTPATGVVLSLAVPGQWTAVAVATGKTSATIAEPVAPGGSVSATFKVTSGPAAFNGDIVGRASWRHASDGALRSETAAQKVRNVSLVAINEFRVSAGAAANPTDSFIELYNAGPRAVDLSNWTLTEHQTEQAPFSAVKIPAGTTIAPKGFYLLGLSTSGLTAPARAGDATIHVRSTAGLSVGDTLTIDTGAGAESRKIAGIGTAAANATTLWQPVPDGPVIAIPVGSTSVPVTSVAGFAVGQKIGIGYGATYPTIASALERYEVATVTTIGKAGTQAFLGADAAAGATNVKVTSVANITAGDAIRLDIDTVGHGIETVTVKKVGTAASRAALAADAGAGATTVVVRGRGGLAGFTVGDRMTIGTPATRQTVTIAAVGAANQNGTGVEFTPALARAHSAREDVVAHGTGLDLAAPLKFAHAANMPFSARGTGIGFTPATAFVHSSNEPVQALGTGVTLDKPLAKAHPIDSVVRDAAATTAGYQGAPSPNQWFGGPALSSSAGAMVLRDAGGLVVDSLNYGLLVDPWASEGYQGVSGFEESGCRAPTPGAVAGFVPFGATAPAVNTPHRSAGRFPDGADTDSNCHDFLVQAATPLPVAAAAGTANIKVGSVADFSAGQTITIDTGANLESAVIRTVGTPGAGTASAAVAVGATAIPVLGATGFTAGQAITIGTGADQETAVVTSIGRIFGPGGPGAGGPPRSMLNLEAPLAREHASGVPVTGTGITLTAPLARAHDSGAHVGVSLPTPGAANKYSKVGK
jgi:non-reducing end alpha-L-arabinofuranosidase